MKIELNQSCKKCEHNAVCRFTPLSKEIITKVNYGLKEVVSDNFSVNLSCRNFRFKRGER